MPTPFQSPRYELEIRNNNTRRLLFTPVTNPTTGSRALLCFIKLILRNRYGRGNKIWTSFLFFPFLSFFLGWRIPLYRLRSSRAFMVEIHCGLRGWVELIRRQQQQQPNLITDNKWVNTIKCLVMLVQDCFLRPNLIPRCLERRKFPSFKFFDDDDCFSCHF